MKRWARWAPVLLTVAAALLPATASAQSLFFDFFRHRYYVPRSYYYGPRSFHDFPDFERHWHDNAREREALRREAKRQAPPKGPLMLVVSVARQRVTVFADGAEIARAPVSTGVPSHPTPTGVFSVVQKQLYHESNLYSAAPMPYMQRITWSGVALHAGPLPGYPASHGCIRLPRDFAIRLYAMTKTGARVVITRDEAAPVDIAHPALFQPKPPEEPKPEAAVRAVAVEMVAAAKPADVPQTDATASADPPPADPPKSASEAPPRKGAVSVFISRKQAKLYVRQGFAPLFEMPISIAEPDKPIGTHVFTALDLTDGGKTMRWSALSIPSVNPRRAAAEDRYGRRHRRAEADDAPRYAGEPMPSAAQALDRLDIPADTRARISELLAPGASLIISDNALSDETGVDTDFVVLTP